MNRAKIHGVTAREVKTQTNYLDQNEGGKYVDKDAAAVMTRGSISVLVGAGAPAPDEFCEVHAKFLAAVYVRVTLNASIPISAVGSFDAVADSTKSVLLPTCVWRTGKDANGVAELLIRTRNI